MDVGLFRDRITFYYFNNSSDGYGGYTNSNSTQFGIIWGYVTPESGNYVENNGKRARQKIKQIIVRKNDFDYLDNINKNVNDISFTIDGETGEYRVNDFFESTPDEYITITGTNQL